jgi:hypothetical protein
MPHRVDADLNIQRFGFAIDDNATRLMFPTAAMNALAGNAGGFQYRIANSSFQNLEGRLDTLRWHADGASLSGVMLHDVAGRFALEIGRAEFPRGVMLVRADQGVELLAPEAILQDVKLVYTAATPPVPSEPAAPSVQSTLPAVLPVRDAGTLRQEQLRFLDGLNGHIALTVKVELDLPVLGNRTLDQKLHVPIKDGTIDFRALDAGLNWLEGAFLDINADRGRLAVRWAGVPILAPSRDIVSCALDSAAQNLAAFGRVPVRSFADFRVGQGSKPERPERSDKKRNLLQSLTLAAIDVALSMTAPRSFNIGNGTLMFGGDDSPGLMDLKVTGSIDSKQAGSIRGAIGSIESTIKDLHLGAAQLTTDRLMLTGIDEFEVTFQGFKPSQVIMRMNRASATKLSVRIG